MALLQPTSPIAACPWLLLAGPVSMGWEMGWQGRSEMQGPGATGATTCVCACVCTCTVGDHQDPPHTVSIAGPSAVQDSSCGTGWVAASASMIPSGSRRGHRSMPKHVEILCLLGMDVQVPTQGRPGKRQLSGGRNHQHAELWLGQASVVGTPVLLRNSEGYLSST